MPVHNQRPVDLLTGAFDLNQRRKFVGVLAVAATVGDSWTWWRVVICAIGAINGTGLLGSAALARRERRQRPAA